MTTNLHQEIQLGESRILEFKKELPAESSKWIKTIAAFANGAGWRLVIGVSNQREIIGIPKETDIFELKDKISDTISQMCTPQIMYDIYQESHEQAMQKAEKEYDLFRKKELANLKSDFDLFLEDIKKIGDK